jgi:hypothetical protein
MTNLKYSRDEMMVRDTLNAQNRQNKGAVARNRRSGGGVLD